MVQDIRVDLISTFTSSDHGEMDPERYFEPDVLIFSDLDPGETQVQNFTLFIKLNQTVPSGENTVVVGGRWSNEPGVIGGDLNNVVLPLHIAPVVCAGFGEEHLRATMEIDDSRSVSIDIYNGGNDFEPPLAMEIIGLDEAAGRGIYVSHELVIDSPGPEVIGDSGIELVTEDAAPGTVELDLILSDQESGRELHNAVLEIEVLEPVEPPVGDDDDEEPPVQDELWSEDECQRTYADASQDDITYWSSFDSLLRRESGMEIGQNPNVDIRMVETYREGENLVVVLDMNGRPELGITSSGITNVYIYFLDAEQQHQQPPMDMSGEGDLYEPSSAIATNQLTYTGGSFWKTESKVQGTNYVIKGAISSLINSGVEPDFDLFVKVAYNDLEDTEEDSIDFRTTVDYAAEGAWKVDRTLVLQQQDEGEGSGVGQSAVYALLAALMIIAVVVLTGSFWYTARRRKKLLR
ncbi:MAG: hypothetical protein R6V01_10180, partial [Thermoplasmatota archaeon]